MNFNLFVYGTLRTDGALHDTFALRGLKPEGIFYTKRKYFLYDCGCPLLVSGGDTSVKGEIYKVDLYQIIDVHLMEIRAGYALKTVEMEDFADPAMAYHHELMSQCDYFPTIPSGDWISYISRKSEEPPPGV